MKESSRDITEFEHFFVNRSLRSRVFLVNFIKWPCYALIFYVVTLPLWVALTTEITLVIGLSLMGVIGFLVFWVRSFITGLFKIEITCDDEVKSYDAVIKKVVFGMRNPHSGASQKVPLFYANGKRLIVPVGSEDLLSRCAGEDVSISTVSSYPIKNGRCLKNFIFQEELILLKVETEDEVFIDVHNMIKHHGRHVFKSYYVDSAIMFSIMASVICSFLFFDPLSYWVSDPGFLMYCGVVLVGIVLSLLVLFVYEVIRKKINPEYKNDVFYFDDKLRGKP